MNNTFKIGSNIRRKRKEANLTQEKLAELSGLSVNFISRIERTDDQNISISKLNSIALALESDIITLLSPENSFPAGYLTINTKKLVDVLATLNNQDVISKDLLNLLTDMKKE